MKSNLHTGKILISFFLLSSVMFGQQVKNQDKAIPLPVQLKSSNISNAANKVNSDIIEQFRKKYGNWSFSFDQSTGNIHRAYGKPIRVKGFETITKENAKDAALAFLKDASGIIAVNTENLKFIRVSEVDGKFYVSFRQVHQGHEVLLSEIELRFFKNGNLMGFGCEYYKDINISMNPSITSTKAAEIASKDFDLNIKTDRVQSGNELYILPVKTGRSVSYKLVYKATVQTKSPVANYITYVDAQKGDIAWRFNKVMNASHELDVVGNVKKKCATDNLEEVTFPNMLFTINSEEYFTDENGKLSINFNGSATVKAEMSGKWAYITRTDSLSNPKAKLNLSISPSDTKVNWNDDNSHMFERQLYYHTNLIHDYFKKLDPAMTCMDFPMYVDIMFEPHPFIGVNAYSAGRSISFVGVSDTNYRFAESPAVLYHEYGHSLNGILYEELGQQDGMINASANEGIADITAAFILNDPEVGKGTIRSEEGMSSIRNVDNINIYPDSIDGESHHDGLILSGAFWDLKEATSLEVAEKLVHKARYATPDDPDVGITYLEWFWETLTADDNDGDLTNGTPHATEIIEAFNKHKIGTNLFHTFNFTHEPLQDSKDTLVPFPVELQLASLPVANGGIEYVNLHYSINQSTFIEVRTTDAGNGKYTASIPSQKAGTYVEYYFSAHDLASDNNIYFSEDKIALKPYTFLVGYNTSMIDKCETKGEWTCGTATSDQASRGKWENGNPNEIDATTQGLGLMQPEDDYSAEGTNCFVTGAGGSSANFQQNMPNGTTTLISPKYTLDGLINPVARFHLWYKAYNPYEAYGMISELKVYISSNNGQTWLMIDELTTSTSDWDKIQYKLSDYMNVEESTLTLKFVVEVPSAQGYPLAFCEALVDDVELLTVISPSVSVDDGNIKPNGIVINAFPNPFSDIISLSVQNNGNIPITLRIFNTLGEEVISLANGVETANEHRFTWNALDRSGNKVPAGVYFYKVQYGSETVSGKLMLK